MLSYDKPPLPWAGLPLWSFLITLITELGRNPWDPWWSLLRVLYPTAHDNDNRHTSISHQRESNPQSPASELPQTHALGQAATEITVLSINRTNRYEFSVMGLIHGTSFDKQSFKMCVAYILKIIYKYIIFLFQKSGPAGKNGGPTMEFRVSYYYYYYYHYFVWIKIVDISFWLAQCFHLIVYIDNCRLFF